MAVIMDDKDMKAEKRNEALDVLKKYLESETDDIDALRVEIEALWAALDTEKEFSQTLKDISDETIKELGETNGNLEKTNSKLEETKQDLQSSKDDIRASIDNLSNSTNNEIESVKSSIRTDREYSESIEDKANIMKGELVAAIAEINVNKNEISDTKQNVVSTANRIDEIKQTYDANMNETKLDFDKRFHGLREEFLSTTEGKMKEFEDTLRKENEVNAQQAEIIKELQATNMSLKSRLRGENLLACIIATAALAISICVIAGIIGS